MRLLSNPWQGIPKAYCICGAMPPLPRLKTTPVRGRVGFAAATGGTLSSKTTLFCDRDLLSQHNTFGLHCGVWVVDYASRQGYNGSVSRHHVITPSSAKVEPMCPPFKLPYAALRCEHAQTPEQHTYQKQPW